MADWAVLLPKGESWSVSLLLRLQARAQQLVASAPAQSVRVALGKVGNGGCGGDALQAVARSVPDAVLVQLGELFFEDLGLGQVELRAEVLPNPGLEALQERLKPYLAGTPSKPFVPIYTSAGRISTAVRENLSRWWENEKLGHEVGVTVGSIALSSTKQLPARKQAFVGLGELGGQHTLGRRAALQQGLAKLSMLPKPPLALERGRARSVLPPQKALDMKDIAIRVRAQSIAPGRRSVEDSADALVGRPPVRVRSTCLSPGTYALGVTFSSHHPALTRRPATRFHFVLDNSGSMGSNTRQARDCFAGLVTLSSGPCSLTVFAGQATVLGESFSSPESMRAVQLPHQGQTNITEGVGAALDIISRAERATSTTERVHHVLVLLSDGAHNRGPTPEAELPTMGAALKRDCPDLRLSVVVVGVTASSNTRMGMLLKQQLETVALPSLEPIYFASSAQGMAEVLGQMSSGLSSLRGTLVRLSTTAAGGLKTEEQPQTVAAKRACDAGFVQTVGSASVPALNILATEQERQLLYTGPEEPKAVLIDGCLVACHAMSSFDSDLVAGALEEAMDAVRLQRVAGGAQSVELALEQLTGFVGALDQKLKAASSESEGLLLSRSSPQGRVSQFKAISRTLHGAKELRNQLAEIEAMNSNNSAEQAAFLTGSRQKYAGKALRRGAARQDEGGDAASQMQAILADLERAGRAMKKALVEDLLAKLRTLSEASRQSARTKLSTALPPTLPRRFLDDLLELSETTDLSARAEEILQNEDLTELALNGLVANTIFEAAGSIRKSFISMQSAWEQLLEWCDSASQAGRHCSNVYEVLMFVGICGQPIDVARRAATQMDPYAMNITRLRNSPADTASLSCAMKSEYDVVPPEGGTAIQDILVLVDFDLPRASRVAAECRLLAEIYTSVVLCRDLNMYTGISMRVALHAHSFLDVAQCRCPSQGKKDLEATMRRQYLGRAYQCAECHFGPVDHFACGDLASHNGELVGRARVDNSCPRCQWFSPDLEDWPSWDGTLPESAYDSLSRDAVACTEASVEMALRICYSARSIWSGGPNGTAAELCRLLAAEDQSLTAADGVSSPVQVLLAVAVLDELPEDCLDTPAVLRLFNEVCARRARDTLRQQTGGEEARVPATARKLVSQMLRITKDSAPDVQAVDQSEPPREEVRATCSDAFELDAAAFDYKVWIQEALQPYLRVLVFLKRLRRALKKRVGGWPKLAQDLEKSPEHWADLRAAMCTPIAPEELALEYWCNVPDDALDRLCATMAAQAFLHSKSDLRRLASAGGSLASPLEDVREVATLHNLAADLRMELYSDRVAEKMKEWHRVGTSITIARARVSDIAQYSTMCGSHVHGLDKETFWGLWNAARLEGAKGQKVQAFLSTANQGFRQKYG